MGWCYFTFGIVLFLAVCSLSVDGRRFAKKGRQFASLKQRVAPKARHVAFLKRPSVVCHCSYQTYQKLKSKRLLRRGQIVKLEPRSKILKKFHRDVIYAPMCCKIDLSNPNKLYRYPMTIRLKEKVFSENYKNSESIEYQALSTELINAINQLFPGDSPLVSVEVTGFRPGSIIADLVLTTKGIFSQDMYDTLKMAIEAGQLGALAVGLVPEGGAKTTPGGAGTTPEAVTGTTTPVGGVGGAETAQGGSTGTTTGGAGTAPSGGAGITPEGTTATTPGGAAPKPVGGGNSTIGGGETTPSGGAGITPEGTTATTQGGTVPKPVGGGGTTTGGVGTTPVGGGGPIPGESTPITPGSAGATPVGGTGTTSEAGSEAAFQNECLCAHNQKRKVHGTPTMTWSAEIAGTAKEWAIYLASIDNTSLPHGKSIYGENLYMEFGDDMKTTKQGSCHLAVDYWYNEINNYDFNVPGYSSDTGHFTQVVWKKSTRIGVAEVLSPTNKRYIVARYEARGNVEGEFAENVPPPLSGTPAPPSSGCVDLSGQGALPSTSQAMTPSPVAGKPTMPAATDILTGHVTPKPVGATPLPSVPGTSSLTPSPLIPTALPQSLPGSHVTPKPATPVLPSAGGVTPSPTGEGGLPGGGAVTPQPITPTLPSGLVTSKPAIPGASGLGQTPKPGLPVAVVTPKPLTPTLPPPIVATNPPTPVPSGLGLPSSGAMTPKPGLPIGAVTPKPITPTLPLAPTVAAKLPTIVPSGLGRPSSGAVTPKPGLPIGAVTPKPITPTLPPPIVVTNPPSTVPSGLGLPSSAAVTPKPGLPIGAVTPKPITPTLPPPIVATNPPTPVPSGLGLPSSGAVTPKPGLPIGAVTPKPITPTLPPPIVATNPPTTVPSGLGLPSSGAVTPKPGLPIGAVTPKPLTLTLSPAPTVSAKLPTSAPSGLGLPGPGAVTAKPTTPTLPPLTPEGLPTGAVATPKPALPTLPPLTPNPLIPGLPTTPPGVPKPGTVTSVTPKPATPIGGSATLSPSGQLPGVTPAPGQVTPSQLGTPANKGTAAPSEPTDTRPHTPYNPSTPAKLFDVVVGLVDQVFSSELSNPASEQFQKLKAAVEEAIMSVYEEIDSFRSVSVNSFRPGVSKTNRKIQRIKRSSPPPWVDAEVELEFKEEQPNQLSALEKQVSSGHLKNLKVLPTMSAAIVEASSTTVPCPPSCMPTNICQPPCPTHCCSPSSTNMCQPACPNTCAPGCTLTCCSIGTPAHLTKKSIKTSNS